MLDDISAPAKIIADTSRNNRAAIAPFIPHALKTIYEVVKEGNGQFTLKEIHNECNKVFNIAQHTISARLSDLAASGCIIKNGKKKIGQTAYGHDITAATWQQIGAFTTDKPKREPIKRIRASADVEAVKDAIQLLRLMPGLNKTNAHYADGIIAKLEAAVTL
jgi:hypothetical protein